MSFDRNRIASAVIYVAVAAYWAESAYAHSDVFLTNVDGRVAVGGANDLEGTPSFELTTHVFEGVMVSDYSAFGTKDYGRGEPGFFALSDGSAGFPSGAVGLSPNAEVSVHLPAFTVNGNTDSLFYWDGSGGVDFQPIASSAQPGVALDLNPNPFSGLDGHTDANGFLHFHPDYELDLGGPAIPADGIYLAALTASVDGMTTSKPFHLVMLVDQSLVNDETAEGLEGILESGDTYYPDVDKDFGFFPSAVQFVRTTFQVPEPTSALLSMFAFSGVSVFISRRRNVGRRD